MDEYKDPFQDLIGLENTKKRLNFYINNYRYTNILPNLVLSSSKGNGKTTIARRLASSLTSKSDKSKVKKYLEINSSTLKGLDSFFDIVTNHLVDSDATVFFDESEAIENDLSLALCSILNPNKENKNKFTYNNNDYLFDFSRLTFLFASTEINKIHHALLDRLTVIDFDQYKTDDLSKIIGRNLREFKVEHGLLDVISTYVRSNPRQAQKMSNDISSYLKRNNKDTFNFNDWKNIHNELGLFEYGLMASEIKVLQILKEYPNSSLTRVASILGSTTENCRKFIETYPLKLGLFEIKPGTGRKLTFRGEELVKKLEVKA